MLEITVLTPFLVVQDLQTVFLLVSLCALVGLYVFMTFFVACTYVFLCVCVCVCVYVHVRPYNLD